MCPSGADPVVGMCVRTIQRRNKDSSVASYAMPSFGRLVVLDRELVPQHEWLDIFHVVAAAATNERARVKALSGRGVKGEVLPVARRGQSYQPRTSSLHIVGRSR